MPLDAGRSRPSRENRTIPVAMDRVSWRAIFTVVASVALVKLVLHLVLGGRYGYFIDELYYLACARRPDWGYVDHPPLSIGLLRAWVSIFDDSLRSIRVPAALAGAATIVLTGACAREFGARRFGTLLACLCALVNPLLLGIAHFYSMNAFEALFWSGALLVLVRTLRPEPAPQPVGTTFQDRPWPWIGLGLLLGLGVLNKIGTLWLGGGIFVALLLTRQRRRLRHPWPWAGVAIATLVVLPYLRWQIDHEWATLEFIRNATEHKYASISRVGFLTSLAVEYHPLTLPVWLTGLVALLSSRRDDRRRAAGIAIAFVLLVLLVNGQSRAHYFGGVLPVLYGAGAATIGARLDRLRGIASTGWRVLVVVLLLVGGTVTTPLVLPVLSVDGYRAYARNLGFRPASAEGEPLDEFPQSIADQLGWPELVDAIAKACDRLEPAERRAACIYVPFYGAAGAVELLGRDRGLPPVICPQNSYWIWGTSGCDGSVVVHLGETRERLLEEFDSVEEGGRTQNRVGMPHVRHRPIWICRGLKVPIADAWREARRYI